MELYSLLELHENKRIQQNGAEEAKELFGEGTFPRDWSVPYLWIYITNFGWGFIKERVYENT
jgi:hypothetical protein